jgi:AcrR family transcriptional regulator
MPVAKSKPKPKPEPQPMAMAPSTKEQLVLTAERLFALHGLDGVSLRQISAEAGNANNSAVQYHFGSKDRLVQAIFEYRIPTIARRRRLLAAERGTDDLRSCVEAYLLPVLEEAEDVDSYYLTFLMQLQQYGLAEHPFDRLPAEFKQPTLDFLKRVGTFLVDLPKPLRATRTTQALSICTHLAADRQLARRHGAPVFPYALHVAELLDGIMGFLEAPVSRATLDALPSTPVTRRSRVVLP